MDSPDLLLAVKPVVTAFDQLSVPYYIGGSIASSLYGTARATMDVDIVADLVLTPLSRLSRSFGIGRALDITFTIQRGS